MTAPWPLDPFGDAVAQCRYIVWEFEGAKSGHRVVNNPRDPGRRTLSGLTLLTYSRDYLRLPAPALARTEHFDALTLDDVVGVMVELFAMRPAIWRIQDPALRFAVLDFAIHAGAHDDAIPALQRALRVTADGQIGRDTLAALDRHPRPRALFAAVVAARYEKAAHRVLKAPGQKIPFILGWFDRFRRVLAIGAAAVLLVLVASAFAVAQDGGERPSGRPTSSLGRIYPIAKGTALYRRRSIRPNPRTTPGLTRPLSLETVCTTRWGLDWRRVTQAMKRQVFEAYGVPWDQRAQYEVDHLVPRSLAGADDVRNLWPEPWAGTHGARKKDRLEVRLGRLVCQHQLSLEAAQTAIVRDWVAAYRHYVVRRAVAEPGIGTSGAAPPPVAITAWPRHVFDPGAFRVRVTVERDAGNRALLVTVDGPAYLRRFGEQLDGEAAARTRERLYEDLPGGEYVITACVEHTRSIRCAVPQQVTVIGH